MKAATTASLFETSLQTTDQWLTEIMHELGWKDRHKALTALRSVLHATRERLPADECAQLTAQLPLLVKGLYWEDWDPHASTKLRHRADFLDAIHAGFRHDSTIQPEAVAHAVFKVMGAHISEGELSDVRGMLPHDLRDLLPEPATAGMRT